jgi:hypothetical protein
LKQEKATLNELKQSEKDFNVTVKKLADEKTSLSLQVKNLLDQITEKQQQLKLGTFFLLLLLFQIYSVC